MNLDLNKGDIVLSGKFKNKSNVVKSFGKDEHNQPTIINDKGKTIKLLAVRIKKLMKEDISLETILEHALSEDEKSTFKNKINEIVSFFDAYVDKDNVNDLKKSLKATNGLSKLLRKYIEDCSNE